jgi:hypothetical protein
MSKHQILEIPCPECRTKVETTVWSSLNVQLDPDAKEDLLNGKLNLFQCTRCDLKAPIAAEFIYHDMDNRYSVQFYPFEALQDDSFFDLFTPDGLVDIQQGGLPADSPISELARSFMENCHIVFSMDELVRYIIFRDRLTEAKGNGGR